MLALRKGPVVWVDNAAMAVASYLPRSVKSAARRWLFRNSHPAHVGLHGVGAVQDLYYWVADGKLDTLLPVQNYFSVFYPSLDTSTVGTLTVFDNQGVVLGRKEFALCHLGSLKLRLSQVLQELGLRPSAGSNFGTLICDVAVPSSVREKIGGAQPFYFWDRFYICYVNQAGQPTFVHGVDKTFICQAGGHEPSRWYPAARTYQWAPEIPVNIAEYQRFSVIVVNRVSRAAHVRLVVEDTADRRRDWNAVIRPNGVHRFELAPANMAGLAPTELRLRVEGMATQWGRPLVFKEFASGDAMGPAAGIQGIRVRRHFSDALLIDSFPIVIHGVTTEIRPVCACPGGLAEIFLSNLS